MTESASDAYTQAADWLVGTAKRNPEALLVLGAGLALLMRGRGKTSSSPVVSPSYQPGGAVTGPSSGWTDGLSRTADNVSGYAADMKDRVGVAATAATEYAGSVGRTISSETSRLAEGASSAVQSGAGRVLDAQPLAIAAFGIATGAALAVLIPSTEMESRTFGSTREAIVDAANQVGENLLDAAGAAGERLTQGAAERGLNAEGLKDLAHDVGETFASKVSGTPSDPQ
jgi:hypothetical protein